MRTKTIRAIEPNAGTKAKLEKKLASYFEAVTKEASRAVFEALINEGVLVEAPQEVAQDADAFALTLNAHDLYMGRPFKLIKGIAPARVEQIVSDVFRKIYAHFLINRGDDAKEVSSWFVRSAAACPGTRKGLEAALEELIRAAEAGLLPFSPAALAEYLRGYRAAGCPPVSHSAAYRAAYHPAYRVGLRSLLPEELRACGI